MTKVSNPINLTISANTQGTSNKLQELEAMEEALKKATEETHQQRLALAGGQVAASSVNTNEFVNPLAQ